MDDIHNVKSAVVDLAAKWQGLGDTLGVRPGDLDAILADNPHFCSDRLRSVLMQWLRQNHMVCTSFMSSNLPISSISPVHWRV